MIVCRVLAQGKMDVIRLPENPLSIFIKYPYRKRTHVVGLKILRRSSDSRLRN